jgi:tetratricopeptide (TPR) repeat protein
MAGFRENNRDKIEKAFVALDGKAGFELQHAFFDASLKMQDGDAGEAMRLAMSAQEHPDVEVESRVLAGEAAYQLGAQGNAKLFWEDALARDPECVAAHQWLGVLYYDLGAMDEALLHLQAVSELSPTDHRPDRLMGLINRDYERPGVAIPHYLESLKRAPNQIGVESLWLELAECQIKQREFDAAMKSLGNCSETAWRNRLTARCLMNLGSLDDARLLAEKVLRAEPQGLEALKLNAEISLLDGNVERAAEFFKLGVEASPFDYNARTQLAQVLGRLGRDDEAAVHTQRAEELQVIWQRFSELHIEAINRPTDAEVRYEMGTLAKQLGKPELAATWFKAALAIDPSMKKAADAIAAQ